MADFIMRFVMNGIAWPLFGLLFGAVLPPLLWPKRRAAAILLFLAGFLFYSEPLADRITGILPSTLLFVGVMAAAILLRVLCRRCQKATPPAP